MPAAPAVSEREALKAEFELLTVEELREAKRLREEKKAQQAAQAEKDKQGSEFVMVYSTFQDYHLGKSAEKLITVKMASGDFQTIKDPSHTHSHHQWSRHRHWMTKADLMVARTNARGCYGQEFVEALPANDGDPLAMNLRDMLKTTKGEQFLARMKHNDEQMMVRPPITPLEVRNEIEAIAAGKIKPPVLK